MKIHCAHCKQQIPGADIDIAAGRAVCRPCGEVVELAALGDAVAPSDLHRPTNLKWSERRELAAWHFEVTPNRLLAIGLAAFATIWCGFIFVWYAGAFRHGAGPGSIVLWFPLLHVAIGVTLVYRALCGLVNVVRLDLDEQRFRCAQRPIWVPRSVAEPTENIERFEACQRGRMLQTSPGKVEETVRMLTRDGRAVMLNFALGTVEHARFVAARLNYALEKLREPKTYRG
jgi:hypothetical protein